MVRHGFSEFPVGVASGLGSLRAIRAVEVGRLSLGLPRGLVSRMPEKMEMGCSWSTRVLWTGDQRFDGPGGAGGSMACATKWDGNCEMRKSAVPVGNRKLGSGTTGDGSFLAAPALIALHRAWAHFAIVSWRDS